MNRVTVADAERGFAELIDKVCAEGISVDLMREHEIVARLTPANSKPCLQVRDLNQFLMTLPELGDDRAAFLSDLNLLRHR
jgi:antitoxin (DNA-binding transcriptional repressor) of toxin-antitoxin stability system